MGGDGVEGRVPTVDWIFVVHSPQPTSHSLHPLPVEPEEDDEEDDDEDEYKEQVEVKEECPP